MSVLRLIGFTAVRAWQGFWRNAMMSLAATATVVLMLVLLSGLYIVLSGMDAGLKAIESKVTVTAELVDDLPRPAREALIAEVEAMPGVKEVTYVSPEEAMERLREFHRARGEELDLGGASIELYASLEIAFFDPSYSAGVTAALGERPEVERIITRQDQYDKLLGIINVFRTVGLVAIGLVGLTVLFMIVNTIRIAVHSRSGEIEIMRLVGASDSFIRWPFIIEGILCGLIGAIITIVLVALVWEPIQPVMLSVFQMEPTVTARFLASLSALLLAVGLGIGAAGSWISVRSYLASAS